MNILIVDDDRLNLKVAEGFIKAEFKNYTVDICDDPKKVLDILGEREYDLLLLDIMMPEISGIELLEIIRGNEKYKEIGIIMLTALTDGENFKVCFDLGANDYITKPIDYTIFKARVSSVITNVMQKKALVEMFEKLRSQNIELKEVNERLSETQFQLLQYEKFIAVGELAAGIAHEINNPIGYIKSNFDVMQRYASIIKEYSKFLQNEFVSKEELMHNQHFIELYEEIRKERKKVQIDFLLVDIEEIISDSIIGINKVASIVKELENFTRNNGNEEKDEYTYKVILDEVMKVLQNEINYVHIHLDIDHEKVIKVVKREYLQAVLNICLNSLYAIKKLENDQRGMIIIRNYEEGEYSCLLIRDNGIGIKEENLSKVFNPFFTSKEVGEGAGLGLSTAYDIIVNKHKGLIDINSTEGIGTEVIIKVPRGE